MKPYSKTCYYCGKKVYPGTGMYYYDRLIHKHCYHLRKARKARWG